MKSPKIVQATSKLSSCLFLFENVVKLKNDLDKPTDKIKRGIQQKNVHDQQYEVIDKHTISDKQGCNNIIKLKLI